MKGLLTICSQCGPEAQILHNINFDDPINEQVLNHLEGYRRSRPVRIGNDAYLQRQLDVFGEVLDAAHNYLSIGGYIGHDDWLLLVSFVDAVCKLWQQPDNGIWEVRGSPRHFVHSKLMCWVAVNRGIKIAQKLGYKANRKRWQKTARQIRNDILSRGWNPQEQAFTQHYDTHILDSSNLLMPLFGFLPVSDERMKSTIQHTIEKLSWNGLLRRYDTEETDDGLSGSEGVFLWCSFWLVRNLIRLNKLEEAIELYQKLLSHGNQLGLFSEMTDPISSEALGNFPQALTHLAVIITGQELTEAKKKQKIV
jgi:GH15 family glucan-1,4-alpha-glucosidase